MQPNEIETTTHPIRDCIRGAHRPADDPLEVSMNSRYLTNLGLAIIGGFAIVASQVWSVPVFMWLMFGAGIVALAFFTGAGLPARGRVQRSLDGVVALIGAWTIVASLIFTGTLVTWLGFASGAAFVALAIAGLTLHELSTERVVHSLEVHDQQFAPVA
jgi:hypothetical protein